MGRTRISTTVSAELLASARAVDEWATDAAMLDAALNALIDRRRSAEIDLAYADAYGAAPLDVPDVWGDVATFRTAAADT